MNGSMAFCPRCRKDVVFTDAGHFRKCTVCGFEFEVSAPRAPDPDRLGTIVMSVGHVLLRVFLIFGVILLVGIAVLFASCALRL
jgi:uncharacterized protein (DUF983 family)